MEIVTIEKQTFEELLRRFEQFTKQVEAICEKNQSKILSNWLDNQDVCLILNISPRTLQTYRDNGTLPYSQINRKMYYKVEDVKQVLEQLSNHH